MAECHVKTEAGLKRLPKEKGAGEVKGILSNERWLGPNQKPLDSTLLLSPAWITP